MAKVNKGRDGEGRLLPHNCQWDDVCSVTEGLIWREDIMGGAWICPFHCDIFNKEAKDDLS